MNNGIGAIIVILLGAGLIWAGTNKNFNAAWGSGKNGKKKQ